MTQTLTRPERIVNRGVFSARTRAEIRKSLDPHIGKERTLISAREFWLYCVGPEKPVRWVTSYKTLLKYISENYRYIFKPKVKGIGSGTRYYLEVDNIVEFLYRFENSKL